MPISPPCETVKILSGFITPAASPPYLDEMADKCWQFVCPPQSILPHCVLRLASSQKHHTRAGKQKLYWDRLGFSLFEANKVVDKKTTGKDGQIQHKKLIRNFPQFEEEEREAKRNEKEKYIL